MSALTAMVAMSLRGGSTFSVTTFCLTGGATTGAGSATGTTAGGGVAGAACCCGGVTIWMSPARATPPSAIPAATVTVKSVNPVNPVFVMGNLRGSPETAGPVPRPSRADGPGIAPNFVTRA